MNPLSLKSSHNKSPVLVQFAIRSLYRDSIVFCLDRCFPYIFACSSAARTNELHVYSYFHRVVNAHFPGK